MTSVVGVVVTASVGLTVILAGWIGVCSSEENELHRWRGELVMYVGLAILVVAAVQLALVFVR